MPSIIFFEPLLVAEIDNVFGCIKSFSKSISCGRDGLRAQHILDALCGEGSTTVTDLLKVTTSVINLWLTGRCSPILAEFVASVSLAPILKPNNRILPIAAGTIWRRLVSKVAMKGVASFLVLNTHFNPIALWPVGRVSAGGTEFTNNRVSILFSKNGTHHRFSCPHTPQQNGRAECKHRHITETGLAMMFNAHVPANLWTHAFGSATNIINRLPTKLLEKKSPYELLFSSKPNYGNFHVFGSYVFPYLQK
nr:putative zinc finger, CCHC-type [Tanacetum cinerariifolium]